MTPELSESLGAELRRSRGVDAALDAELLHQLWRLRIASFYELFSSLLTTLLRPLGCPRRVLMRRFGLSLRPRRWRMGVRFWVLELRHGLDAIHSLWVALDFLLQAMEGEKKPSRWRRDRREVAPVKDEAPTAGSALCPPSSNEAAAHAFRGLHGRKSDFSLLASASGATFSAVLDGNAHYYKALASELENFSTYEALVSELEYRPAWMSGGLALHRPAALGSESQLQKSPTYERIVRFLAGFFGVEPIRSLVNHYRSAEDFTAFHSDQYFSGVNMTIGASFGEERSLVFEHRETKEQFSFPQQNGDVFAFTDSVNRQFVHGIPRERTRAKSVGACRHTPGRISVIVWGRRDQEIWKQRSSVLPITLLPCNVLEYDPTAGSGEEAEAKRSSAEVAFAKSAPERTTLSRFRRGGY